MILEELEKLRERVASGPYELSPGLDLRCPVDHPDAKVQELYSYPLNQRGIDEAHYDCALRNAAPALLKIVKIAQLLGPEIYCLFQQSTGRRLDRESSDCIVKRKYDELLIALKELENV